MNITPIWQGHNRLGEGPIWDHRQGILYWLDIKAAELHAYSPSTRTHHEWSLPSEPACIILREKGDLLIALAKEFIFFDTQKNAVTAWIKPTLAENEVFNDGKCGPCGNIWIGSKDVHEKEAIGKLYRISPEGVVTIMDEGFIVSNGMGFSPNKRAFYFTDGDIHRQILHYDFNVTDGTLSHRKVFATIPAELGYPDGLTVDKEGFIWSAHWDGWRITRYSDDGRIERVIVLPVPRVTSCCFGTSDENTLFITSASLNLTSQQLNEAPYSGALFGTATATKGISEFLFPG